jgi:predicted nucleotidyltransferase
VNLLFQAPLNFSQSGCDIIYGMKLGKTNEDNVRKYFENKPEIAAVYLFGSFAKGYAKKYSDIDIAVLVKNRKSFSGFDTPRTRYTYDLEKLMRKKVEVQDLDSVSVDFAQRVISEGKILLGLESKKRVEFEEKVLRMYFDMKPFFDEYFKSIHEIAKRGELNVRYN